MAYHGRALLGSRQLVALAVIAFSLPADLLLIALIWAAESQVSVSKLTNAGQNVAARILNSLSLPTKLDRVDLAAVGG